MFGIGHVLLVLQSQPHTDDAWRQQYFQWCGGGRGGLGIIHYVRLRTVLLVFMAEGSSEIFCWG